MKHSALFLGAALAVLAQTPNTRAADDFDIKVYTAQKIASPIQLDGRLDEKAWQQAPVVGGFTTYGKPDAANPQTFFRMVYDDQALYLGVTCDEPDMAHFVPVAQARDAMGVFHGETVEFFIDPAHSHSDYYQIAVNAAGSIYDSRGQDPVWNADVQAAAAPEKTSWSLEIKVPWKDLHVTPKPGTLIGFNLCRDRYIGDKQWTNWARVTTGFHDPIRFAHLVLSPTPAQLGSLAPELRTGDRQGPILIYGKEGISDTTYRAMAEHAINSLDTALQQLDETAAAETTAAAREELRKLVQTYREAMKPFRKQVAAAKPIDGQQWTRMDLQLASLHAKLRNAIWEARLKALLADI